MVESHNLLGLVLFLAGWGLHLAGQKALERVGVAGLSFATSMRPTRYLQTGIFRLRHPCYLGALVWIAGLGILALGWGGAAVALGALPFYAQRIVVEEHIRRTQ